MLITTVKTALPLLPPPLAYQLVKLMVKLPRCPRLKPRDHAALAEAKEFQFGHRTRKTAWMWGDASPTVLLLHGWGGHSAQMAYLASTIAKAGFTAIAFDASAHNLSSGKLACFGDFIDDVGDFIEYLQRPISACLGHSIGGYALLAARKSKGLAADKYICLNTPLYPYVPIQEIRHLLHAPDNIVEKIKTYYAAQLGYQWEELERGCVFDFPGRAELLLIYDRDDSRVSPDDGAAINALWPRSRLFNTTGLGHQKVLWNDTVAQRIVGFLQDRPAE